MKKVSQLLTCAAAAVALFGATAVHADRHDDGLSLVCGGFGSEEHSRMLDEQAQHALTIIFATREGAYVAGVNTHIEGPDGERVEKSCGPIGQVNVSRAGRYQIVAEQRGETVRHSAQLRPSGGARVVMRIED